MNIRGTIGRRKQRQINKVIEGQEVRRMKRKEKSKATQYYFKNGERAGKGGGCLKPRPRPNPPAQVFGRKCVRLTPTTITQRFLEIESHPSSMNPHK